MYCNCLHAWWSTQSWLATLLPYVITMHDFTLSNLKTYLFMEGSDVLAVVRPTRVYLLDFFCSGIQFYVL